MKQKPWIGASLLVVCVLMLPAVAAAQGIVAGVITDASGAVMPGVTVEAASPALIEKVRSVVSNDQGRYSIVDLRPGVYTLTFTLAGFRTVRRDGVELQSSVTVPINAEMIVGALEESVTVSGETPVVDVQSTQRTQVMTRDIIDALPIGRMTWSIGALVQGVKMDAGDVGGSRQTEQSYMLVRGLDRRNTTTQVDGMFVGGTNQEGGVNVYYDDAMIQELTYQVSGAPAEIPSGGIRLNVIPKDGGNTIRGLVIATGSSGDWQSENVTPELRARGLSLGNKLRHVQNFDGSVGGPIIKDKLWILGASRYQATPFFLPNITYTDGRRVSQGSWIVTNAIRPTWQINQKNKLTAFANHNFRSVNHEPVSQTAGELSDPLTTLTERWHPIWYVATVKWTAPVTSRFLLEAGVQNIPQYFTRRFQDPSVRKARFTPEWYANASRMDRILNTRTTAPSTESETFGLRKAAGASVSYVSGSHTFKTGVQLSLSRNAAGFDNNADLIQEYNTGTPASVLVFTHPSVAKTKSTDVGVYAQDTWSFRRLTLSPGARLDHIEESIVESDVPAGRFVPARHVDGVSGINSWTTVSPRLGVVYDLFGTAKTALKASYGVFQQAEAVSFANTYHPVFVASERRTWQDSNRDDIAQDSEIGPTSDLNFGLRAAARPDPDYKRVYNTQVNFGLQQEVRRGIGLGANWYRRTDYNLPIRVNQLRTLTDWSPVSVTSPLDGEIIQAYNLNRTLLGRVDFVDFTSTDSETRSNFTTGFEVSVNARLPRGANVLGGWNAERTTNIACSAPDDPNTLRYCDQSQLGLPLRHEFKVAGNLPLWYGFEVSEVFQSYAGNPLDVLWNVTPTTRNADGTLVIPSMTNASLTISLIPPGSKYLERRNQLDLGLKRVWRMSGIRVDTQLDVFNVLNTSVVLTENQTFGLALGRPLSIYQPRILRLGTQIHF